MFCQVIQKGRGAHGKAGGFVADLPCHFGGAENILQNRRAAQHDGQHNAIHEAKLMRQRRWHMDDIIAAKPKPFRKGGQVGQHGVGRMRNPLGFARCAAGIKKLDHFIWPGAIGGSEARI